MSVIITAKLTAVNNRRDLKQPQDRDVYPLLGCQANILAITAITLRGLSRSQMSHSLGKGKKD
jgi:hypothetical protein